MLGTLLRLVRKIRDELHLSRDPVGFARSLGVKMGTDCRLLGLRRATFGTEPYLVRLGDHVTVTGEVEFITHDGGVWVFRDRHPDIELFGPIVVGSNVFIGRGAKILPGVRIGDNCVIGACALVTRDVPSNTVVGGVPAKVIKRLDEYWDKVKDRATFLRSLPPEEKRRRLEADFPSDAAAGGSVQSGAPKGPGAA